MTLTAELPKHRFVQGPASGTRPVLPTRTGELPAHVAIPEPIADYPYADPPDTGAAAVHIYQRQDMPAPRGTVYLYLRSLPPLTDRQRIVCPDCARPTHLKEDIEDGYCGACHANTAIPRRAVLRPAPETTLPDLLDGAGTDRTGDVMRIDVGGQVWIATSTGRYEICPDSGRWAEVFTTEIA